ncbi:hypothetical protein ACL02U_27985 [Streptomyces sp. MS06]|uniref:hypothetical protein n=1 Tax=Streptomyces sp. MS06 TaxID=3385974 RepID=UPI00399F1DBB
MACVPSDDDSGPAVDSRPAVDPGPAVGPGTVACARCGVQAGDALPVTWTCSVEDGVRRHFCETCSRQNLRAIEGRLDSAWW